MNWLFLLTLYGTAQEGPNPIANFLASQATNVLVGGTEETLGYRMYDSHVAEVIAGQKIRPFSYYGFSDSAPDEILVPNRGTTFFNYFNGTLADDVPTRSAVNLMLNMNRSEGPPGSNYTELVHNRVMANLHGKFSMMIAQLGQQPSFIFGSSKLPFYIWLVSYAGMYYLVVSNVAQAVDRLETHILDSSDRSRETYYQQAFDVPVNATMILRPVYAITKFRSRIHSYSDKSSRKLLICNYFRKYIQKQCFLPQTPTEE